MSFIISNPDFFSVIMLTEKLTKPIFRAALEAWQRGKLYSAITKK